jgi:hypothetical protein
MNRNRSWKPRAQSPRFRTARAVNAHVLGKATENVKLELPEALKRELEPSPRRTAALSDYLRGVLARSCWARASTGAGKQPWPKPIQGRSGLWPRSQPPFAGIFSRITGDSATLTTMEYSPTDGAPPI